MKVGIMQPYFFPYLGYFQLIKEVDLYVNLDHVSFMKRSYMTRNRLKNSLPVNLQVASASQNKTCREVYVSFEHDYLNKFFKTLHNLYSKSPFFDEVMEQLIVPNFFQREVNVSDFNLSLIKKICEMLSIETKILETSSNFQSSSMKREKGLQGITKELGSNTYINAVGGMNLYNKENFKESGVDLFFIKSKDLDLEDPYASILHQLMIYPTDHIKNQITRYELI